MANTQTIDLVKPSGTDYALISTINGNMDKIDAEAAKERGNFAGTYSASSAYAVGDYCVYQGNLYRCTTAIGSGGEAWTAGHWTQISVGSALASLNDQIETSYDNVAYAKLTDIQSMLGTIAASLPVDQTKFIRIHTGTDTSLAPFTAWNDFIGYMQRQSTNYWIATLVGRDGVDVTVTCSNGTLRTYSLSGNLNGYSFIPQTAEAASTHTYNNRAVKFRKNGNVATVFFDGLVQLAATATTKVCDIPSGYVPGASFTTDIYTLNSDTGTTITKLRISITNGGAINIYNYSSSIFGYSNLQLMFTYMLGFAY